MKDTQEQSEELYNIFSQVQEVDEQSYCLIIEMLRKEKISDCIGFLSQDYTQKILRLLIDKSQEINVGRNNINIMNNVIKQIKDHDFNKNSYSSEIYMESKQYLIKKISQDKKIIEFFKFLVRLTAFDNQIIYCGSNSLHLLVEMKIDLTEQCLKNITIQNTSLAGANFLRCNLSGSKFDYVDVSGINLNGALLFHCKWKNLKIHELHKMDGHNQSVNSVCFSPNGRTLASGSLDKSVRLWDVKTGQQILKLDGHTSIVYSVCFSPDGTTLASGSVDKSIRLWDVKTGQQKSKLNGHTSFVISVCFSPDGNTLASGSADTSICLWDVQTRQLKSRLDGHRDYVRSVCFSPDGTTLASGSTDKSIRLWDVMTKKQKSKLHMFFVQSLCHSPDGATLLSSSADCSIRLWDVKTGQQVLKLDGHTSYVTSACFSPDGTTLASGSWDKSIRLWNAKTGQQISKLDGHSNQVQSVCFSPDGTTLASGSEDSSIRLWDVKKGQQILHQDSNYSDLLVQLQTLQYNSILEDDTYCQFLVNTNVTILQISKQPMFLAQGALILQGEFFNNQGVDLRSLFKSKGSCFLEGQLQLIQI